MTKDDLLDLKEHLVMYESKVGMKFPSVMNYIDSNLKVRAKKPSWVSINEGESISMLNNTSLGLSLDDKDVFMKEAAKGMDLINVKGDKEDFLRLFMSTITDNVDKDTSSNQSFRVWGPENRFDDRDCVSNPEAKGPCRMLLCTCRDAEENEGEIKTEWFTGECDNCKREIQDISHAVRYPAREGGWKGCYCCFRCVFESPPYQMKKEDNARLKMHDTRLKEIGIMDRSVL